MLKNWKTTLMGLLAGGAMGYDAVMQALMTGGLTGKSGWQLVAAIAVIFGGAYAADHNQTVQK